MVSKKQKVRTVFLVLVFAVAIVAGVFGISYVKGGVTYPWEITSAQSEENTAAKEPEQFNEQKQIIQSEETEAVDDTKDVKAEEPQEETTEETVNEEATEELAKESSEDAPEEESEEADAKDADTETSVASTGISLDYYGAIHVEDGNLVDEDGNSVQLTGVSSHGLSWYPEYITEETISSLRDNWGINVIRLAMYTSDYNGYCVAGSDIQETLKDNIDEAISAATVNDMYVIIDWHILNDGDPNEYKSEAIQFFGEMVRKYKDYDNVIYEICNEPNGETTWDDVRRYANEVIPVIRNVNKDALILVGTPEWSSDLESVMDNPLDFDNIMYTYHFYGSSHGDSYRENLTSALEDGLPVFISEYGFTSADGDGDIDESEAEAWMEIIDEYNLSSCIWNLSNKDETSALINSDCEKTADFLYDDLSEHGKYFFDYLTDNTDEAEDNEDSNNEEDSDADEQEVVEDVEDTTETEKTVDESSSDSQKDTKANSTKNKKKN